MAIQIPSVTGPRIANRALPTPQVRAEVQVPSLGESLAEPAAQAAGKIWQKSQEDADTTAIIQAESQLSDWKLNIMFHPESGVYNKKGASALDITNQTLPQYDAEVDRISGTLTNDRQKARFQQLAAGQRASLNGELNRYEFGERQSYYDDVDKASLQSATAGATAYYNDPQQVAYYQNKASRVIASAGQRKGLPVEMVQQQVLKQNSAISTAVIQRMAVDDPLKAQQYYAANIDGMTFEDQADISKLLGTSVRKQWGAQMADAAYNLGSGGVNALPTLIIQAESSGDPMAVSPKGARGLMQLMPDTAKEMAAELGIPYDETRLTTDANYNTSLGTAYLNKLLGRYNGNTTLAVAAYNAGPGNVDEWIKTSGDPRKGEISDADFVQKIPFAETRNYTSKIVGQLTPTGAKSALAAATQWGNHIQDPEMRKFYFDKLDDLNKATVLTQQANYETASNIVYQQGMDAVPSELLNALTTEDRVKLDELDLHRRKGTEPTTVMAKFESFLKMPAGELKQLSLERDIRPYLNNSDFSKISSAWKDAQNGSGSAKEALAAENTMLNRAMNMAGINTGDNMKANAPENLKLQDQFRAAYEARVQNFIKSTGKQPSPKEQEDLANQLMLNVRLRGAGTFGGDSSVKFWEVAPEQLSKAYLDKGDIEVDQIPAGERLRIVNNLKRTGQTVSDETIVQAYLENISGLGVSVQ